MVEDDKDLNKTVCSFLNHSGYEAIGCINANDAKDDFEIVTVHGLGYKALLK